jgi:hypothetical protein
VRPSSTPGSGRRLLIVLLVVEIVFQFENRFGFIALTTILERARTVFDTRSTPRNALGIQGAIVI